MSALTGLRVVELSGGIAGPGVGMFFADFGADVVKVEPPTGDPARELPGFQVWNRGKRSIVADGDPATEALLRALLLAADVCICQSLEEISAHGLTLVELTAANPGIVIALVSPWVGPAPWSGGEESAELLSASTGLAANQCSFTGGPIELVEPQILYIQAAWAAASTVAALIERERTGAGQVVTVTGVHAFAEFAPHLLVFEPDKALGSRAFGPGGPNPTYTVYEASDGKWFFIGALPDKFRRRVLDMLDVGYILDDPRIGQVSDRMFDPENYAWVRDVIAAGFRLDDRQTWLERLEAADVPVGPLMEPEEWFDHPHVLAMGGRNPVEHPRLGTVEMPTGAIRMWSTPAETGHRAPELDEHRDLVQPWAAQEWSGRQGPATSAAGPLAGLTVLSLGAYVAGPYSARLLGELGATVVKVEPSEGDPWRMHGFQFSDGMLGLALDIRTPAGKAAMLQLVSTADVVIDNFRPGVLQRLGIDYDSLRAVNPTVITLSVTGFGEIGPLSPRPGFDPVLGAMSGQQSLQGGSDEPVMMSLAVNDTGTGALAALGSVLALYHRARTGQGQRVGCSLAATAGYLLSGTLVRYPDRPRARRGGRDFRGAAPHTRYYQAADGWVRIETSAELLPNAMESALDIDPELFATSPSDALEAAILPHSVELVVDSLNAHGVRTIPVRTSRDLVADSTFAEIAIAHKIEWPDGYGYYTLGRLAQFSNRLPYGPLHTPGIGEHSVEVMRNAGISESDIDEMLADKILVQGSAIQPRVLTTYR